MIIHSFSYSMRKLKKKTFWLLFNTLTFVFISFSKIHRQLDSNFVLQAFSALYALFSQKNGLIAVAFRFQQF